jgi:putative transposase
LIATEKATHPLRVLCRVQRVTPSGFYSGQRRPLSVHARRDGELDVRIRALFTGACQRYGSPRIHDDLREADVPVSRKRVARMMRQAELRARQRKRYRSTTMSEHDQRLRRITSRRRSRPTRPVSVGVGDTTEFAIGTSGKLYLAAILDMYSRFVVGWAVSAVNDRHLTIKALDQALRRRGPAWAPAPFRSGLHVRQRRLPAGARGARLGVQHEPARKLLRQRGGGELLLHRGA